MSNRDDFSSATKSNLARRVGYKCSFPDCRISTDGPHTNPNKYTSIGVAAHISAASIGGPRYDDSLTEFERKDISNAIWLCENHARLIDKDENRYTKETLYKWKLEAEELALTELGVVRKLGNPFIEAELRLVSQARFLEQVNISKTLELLGPGPMSPFDALKDYKFVWDYELIIYNNSAYPAYNLKLINESGLHFIDTFPKVNNLPSLDSVKLSCTYNHFFTGTGKSSKPILEEYVSSDLLGQVIKIEYSNEARQVISLPLELDSDGIANI